MSAPETLVDKMTHLHARAFPPGWSAQDFREHLDRESDHVRTISVAERLAGFVIARLADGQAEILTLVVDPQRRRRNYGRTLMTMIEESVAKDRAEIMFLEVAADNQAAIRLYQKCGYQPCGRRPGYYRREVGGRIGRIDAIVYQKHLA